MKQQRIGRLKKTYMSEHQKANEQAGLLTRIAEEKFKESSIEEREQVLNDIRGDIPYPLERQTATFVETKMRNPPTVPSKSARRKEMDEFLKELAQREIFKRQRNNQESYKKEETLIANQIDYSSDSKTCEDSQQQKRPPSPPIQSCLKIDTTEMTNKVTSSPEDKKRRAGTTEKNKNTVGVSCSSSNSTSTSESSSMITVPRRNDALLGRGLVSNSHPGNAILENLIETDVESYQQADTQFEKSCLVLATLQRFRSFGGRFLTRSGNSKEKKNQSWVVADHNEAYKSICKRFRDRARKLSRATDKTSTSMATPTALPATELVQHLSSSSTASAELPPRMQQQPPQQQQQQQQQQQSTTSTYASENGSPIFSSASVALPRHQLHQQLQLQPINPLQPQLPESIQSQVKLLLRDLQDRQLRQRLQQQQIQHLLLQHKQQLDFQLQRQRKMQQLSELLLRHRMVGIIEQPVHTLKTEPQIDDAEKESSASYDTDSSDNS